MSPLVKVAIPFIGVIMIGILAILLLGVGDEAEVRRVYEGMRDAAIHHDAERLVGFIDPEYSYGGETYAKVTAQIRQQVGPGRYEDVVELDDPAITVLGENATLEVRLAARWSHFPRPVPFRVRLEMTKREEGWKVSAIDVERKLSQ